MPKTITTGKTITLSDTDIASITFAYEDGADGKPEFCMIVKYKVLKDDGTPHEVHSVGRWPGFAGAKAAVKAMMDGPALKREIMTREGLN